LELAVNDGEEFSHLHRTIISCYVRDTTLSANLYQPACLGNLGLVSATLNNHNPSDALLGVRLSYAKVHEAIIRETRKCAAGPVQSNQIDIGRMVKLRDRMLQIKFGTEEVR
jgi:hypothetical protein